LEPVGRRVIYRLPRSILEVLEVGVISILLEQCLRKVVLAVVVIAVVLALLPPAPMSAPAVMVDQVLMGITQAPVQAAVLAVILEMAVMGQITATVPATRVLAVVVVLAQGIGLHLDLMLI